MRNRLVQLSLSPIVKEQALRGDGCGFWSGWRSRCKDVARGPSRCAPLGDSSTELHWAALDFRREDKAVRNLRVAPAGVVSAVRGGLVTHDLAVVHRHPHAVELELELAGLGIVAGSDWPAVVLAAALPAGWTAEFGEPVMSEGRTGERQGYGGEQSASEHRLGLSRIVRRGRSPSPGGCMARRCLRPLSTLFRDAVFHHARRVFARAILFSRVLHMTCWKNYKISLANELNFARI